MGCSESPEALEEGESCLEAARAGSGPRTDRPAAQGPGGARRGGPSARTPGPEPPPPTVSEVRTHSRGQEPVTTRNRLCHGVWFASQGTPGHAFGLRGSFRLGAQGRGHHAWPFFWEAAQNNKGRAVRGREGCGSDGRRRHGEAEGSRARGPSQALVSSAPTRAVEAGLAALSA